MPKEMPTPNEVMRLMQSATDAVNDLDGSGVGPIRPAGENTTGTRETLRRAKGKMKDWGGTVHAFARQRPLTCTFIAFVAGVAFGLTRSRAFASRKD